MDKLKYIAEQFGMRGIQCYFVGGCVRNEIMNIENDDIDICLVGVKDKRIVEHIVGRVGTITEEVGKNFPNWIATIDEQKVDFALARTEKKIGDNHQDFECETENVTIVEDLYRRDLTINAIAKDVLTGEIVDPFNGINDIHHRYLHPVSDAFMEDDLRVVRAARFYSYFPDFTPTDKLIRKGWFMNPENVSKERFGTELMKVMKYAKKPSNFFKLLDLMKWLEPVFPEVHALKGVPQHPKHHPEGDAYVHTMYCMDAALTWMTRITMLCHDLGKAVTTEVNGVPVTNRVKYVYNKYKSGEEKITAHGHEEAGAPIAKVMLDRLVFSNTLVREQVAMLTKLHMIRIIINKDNYNKVIRKTMRQLMSVGLMYYDLCLVVYLDLAGRPPIKPLSIDQVMTELFYDHYVNLHMEDEMKPIVTGKILVEMGLDPGPMVGKIVKHALELQDRGTLTKDNWMRVLKGAGYQFFKNKI